MKRFFCGQLLRDYSCHMQKHKENADRNKEKSKSDGRAP